MTIYAVRIVSDGFMDFKNLRYYWENLSKGRVLVHEDGLGRQVFDMIFPVDVKLDTKQLAKDFAKMLREEFDCKAEVVEVLLN